MSSIFLSFLIAVSPSHGATPYEVLGRPSKSAVSTPAVQTKKPKALGVSKKKPVKPVAKPGARKPKRKKVPATPVIPEPVAASPLENTAPHASDTADVQSQTDSTVPGVSPAPFESVLPDPAAIAPAVSAPADPVVSPPTDGALPQDGATEEMQRTPLADPLIPKAALDLGLSGPWMPDFIKGQFSQPGMTELISRFNHITQGFGISYLDSRLFAVVNPMAAWYFKQWSFGVQVPMRLLAFEPNPDRLTYGSFKVRREDWDEVSDYFRVIRFLTYGRQEDRLYASINTLRPLSLGHEQLFTRYQGSIDRDKYLTSLQFEWYNDYVGTQLLLNDITLQGGRILGALAFVKPGAFLHTKNMMLNSLSLGLEYGGDFAAPRCIRRNVNGDQSCVQGQGNITGNAPVTGYELDGTYVRAGSNRRYDVNTAQVHALGTSIEVKVLQHKNEADLKLYSTFHHFLNQGGGNGGAMGFLGRFNATTAGEWIHGFRVRGEYRVFGDGYLPGYFDTTYELSKYEYGLSDQRYQATPTRYQRVFGDPSNGFARANLGIRHGYRAELQYGAFLNSRQNKKFALSLGVEDSTGPFDTSAFIHVDMPILGWLQFFGTYMRVKGENFSGLFSKGGYYGGDVYIAGLRLQILWVAFLNIKYMRMGQLVGNAGSEYHIGNSSIPDRFGDPAGARATGLFLPASTLMFDLEFGWEADDGFNLFERMRHGKPKKKI